MVSDTRSGRKIKDEADGKKKLNNEKNTSKHSSLKADIPGVRRSIRETSLSGQTTPSPKNTRKSSRLEKETPPSTPPATRKSLRLEKNNTPSPLRRSDRGRKTTPPSSSPGKQTAKENSSSESKMKKEKNLIQLVMESEKAPVLLESVGEKRKKMNARTFKALFKRQCIQDSVPGVDGELRGRRKLSINSNLTDNVSHESPDGDSRTSPNAKETLDDSEKLPKNCSPMKDIDVTETESSSCLAKPLDGAVSSERGKKSRQPEATIQPSSKSESHSLLGPCVLCSKHKRISYDSPEKELCSCTTVDEDPGSTSACEDRVDNGAAIVLESPGKCAGRCLLKETRSDYQMDGHENACTACNNDGKLLCCGGKGCKKCYHFHCLDPPLTDILPGVWHCPSCVRRKIEFGVHSVSEGAESVWDAREVEVSNAEGIKQRQYLVKYHGLAHIHNHWVPEKQLLLENPCLISNFKEQIPSWRVEWTVPHRLLRKELIKDKVDCNCQWLVKWRGLDYDHATWELGTSYFLSTSLGQDLIKDYETRCEKAKTEFDKCSKGQCIKLSELPVPGLCLNDDYLLKNINKLLEFWFKCHNAVVFDNQDRSMTMVLFIRSLAETCQPFLIVAPADSISQWEAEFIRLAPSVDCVVYSGNPETRKWIRTLEFYGEGGCLMLQALLCSPENVVEDAEMLKSINWRAIVIDASRHAGLPNDLEQIKMFHTELRILLCSGQLKDTASEYLSILSLLESSADFDKLKGSKYETNDNLVRLKERLFRFVAYGRISEASRFLEYWVPVEISNHQLEQYCATLLSNSIALGSCSKSDPVGALRDILHTVRKCCDHPYLVDSSVQERSIAEGRLAAELLDIGIKASGKLQLLDLMLTEIKTRGMQVLILFQLIRGLGGTSTGDILDDFLRQKFGQNTYERVDNGITPSKKQTAVNRFNNKDTGQFVLLLENRACSSSIKLSSLDIILIYNSEWNPASDLRALQKISVDSKAEQIKVFRLYSSCTIEEKALLLSNHNLNLENNLQNLSRATSNTLLMWGAAHLFSKFDNYVADSSRALNIPSGELLLNRVVEEFQGIISERCEVGDLNSIISKVKLDVGRYITYFPMLGESKIKLKDGEEPHVFWKNLLNNRNPQWKLLKEPCPRNRKRVQYFEGSPSKPGENDDVGKKRKRLMDPASFQVEFVQDQATQVAGGSKEGLPPVRASGQPHSLQKDSNSNCMTGQSSSHSEFEVSGSGEGIALSNDQNSLQNFLQQEMMKLCQILKLSEDVTNKVRSFLGYVIKNHHVSSDSPAIVQAFQISLCWTAASISKQKVDKKASLMLAKELLNYQCTEEQASSVYSKMRALKKLYLHLSEKTVISGKDCLLAEEDICKEPSNVNEGGSKFASFELQNVKTEIEENLTNEGHVGVELPSQQKLTQKNKDSGNEIHNKIEQIQRKCDKRMKKLMQKQQEEVQEFQRIWEEKRLKLERDHKLESALIRSIHGQGSARMDKLKVLDDNFAKQMKEHNLMKDVKLKDLNAEQLAARNKERQKAARWLAEAKAWSGELIPVSRPESLDSPSEDDARCPQAISDTTTTTRTRDAVPVLRQCTDDQNQCNNVCERRNAVALPESSVGAPAEGTVLVASIEAPINSLNENPQNQVVITSSDRLSDVEKINQSKHPNDIGEVAHADVERVSDETQLIEPNVEVSAAMPETGPNKIVDQSSSKGGDRGDAISASHTAVNHRDGTNEQTIASPDTSGLSLQQLAPDKIHISSSELRVQDTPEAENQTTLQIDVADPELSDTVTAVPSSNEQQSQEAPVLERQTTPQIEVATIELVDNVNPGQNIMEHDQDVHLVENQHDSLIEISTSELVDTVNPMQSVTQPQDRDAQVLEVQCTSHTEVATMELVDVVAPAESNIEAPVEASEQPGMLVSVSPNCEEAPAVQIEHQNHDVSSQTANAEETEVLSHEPQNGETLEIQSNHHDPGSVSRVAPEHSVELPASSAFNVAVSQMSVTTAERPNQAGLQLGADAGRLHGSSYSHVRPMQRAPSLSITSEPLQSEIENIKKEIEQLEKGRQDMTAQLKSDCEKEIAQVRKKYELKLQNYDAECTMKKNELDKNCYRVVMNKLLAEAFRSKCLDHKPEQRPGMTSSFMQHLHQLSLQPSARSSLSPGPSAHRPVNPDPPVRAIQQLPRPQFTRPSLVSSQNVAGPSAQQAVQHASSLFSGSSSRPPVIGAITPAGNPRVSGEIRSRAPHLQSCRPPPSVAPANLAPISQHRPQQMLPSQPLQPLPQLLPSTSQNRPELQPTLSNLSLSALGLLMDMDHRSSVARSPTASILPENRSTSGPSQPSNSERVGNVQVNPTPAAPTDVVCLSDDED